MAKMKILEADSAQGLEDQLNEHLAIGWQIAGNNYTVAFGTHGHNNNYKLKASYSILIMMLENEVLRT